MQSTSTSTTTNKSTTCIKTGLVTPMERNLPLIRSTLQKAISQIHEESSTCRALSFIKRISLDLDFDRMEKMLVDLEKGYVVIKHSQNTCEPHDKYIYISSDRRFLCWKSLQKDDQKIIQLKKIENIIQNEVQFKAQSKTIHNFDRVLIIKSQVRTLEVEFRSKEEKIKFYDQIRMALKNSRRMHLSYKF